MLEHPEATAYNLYYERHVKERLYNSNTSITGNTNNTKTEKFVPFEKKNGEIRYQSTSTGKLFYKEDGTFKELTLLHKLRGLML